jgi:hypothetical protein
MDNPSQMSLVFESDDQAKLAKEEVKLKRNLKEKSDLLDKVLSGNINTSREKVAYILNNSIEARNSDVELAWLYWENFESHTFNGITINKEQLKKMTGINTLSRSRAKIQNEYKLFEAHEVVKKHRGVLEEEKRNEAINDKPLNLPLYSVYIDETGKNDKYLIIGSLWIIDGGFLSYKTNLALAEWTKMENINFEFHFTQVSKHKLQSYKEFFIKFLTLNPTIGFKAIMVQNQGFQELTRPITDLTFHLIHKGIQHEDETGRAPLPRVLQVWLDDEEKGSDNLKLENLRERLTAQKINGLVLKNFEAVVSKKNYFIQAVDLFTASINRKLNNPINEGHFKDELADFILRTVKFNIEELNKSNTEIDKSVVFNLSDLSQAENNTVKTGVFEDTPKPQ